MRKHALYRDTFREIKRTMGRFLSILLITALGTAFFAGIKTAAPVMEQSYNEYAAQSHLTDIRLASTVGFDDADVRAIKAQEGVNCVQPTYQTDVFATIGGKNSVATLICLHHGAAALNVPQVVEGRLPQNENECAVDTMHFNGVALGETVSLSSGTDDPLSDTLYNDKLTVVGKVKSLLYPSLMRGSSTIGSGVVDGFIMVVPELFALSVYTDVYVEVKDAQALNVFSDAYTDLVDPVITCLESLGKRRGTKWYIDTVAQAKSTLARKQQEYNDAVDEADKEFSRAQRKINSGYEDIQAGEKEIESARQTLSEQETQGKEGIRLATEALAEQEAAYGQAYAQYLAQSEFMTDEQRTQAETELSAWKSILDEQAAAIDLNEQTLLQTVAQTTAYLDEKERTLNEGRADLRAAQSALNRAKADADEEFSDAQEELREAERDIEDIPEAKWYVLGLDSNTGFVEYGMSADRIRSISQAFPVLFFFIAALVCLTTMTRMVDEQRGNMGTLKALGYTKGDIANKYLIYAAIASITGSVLGVAVGMWLFPYTIFTAYSMMFNIPGPSLIFHAANAILAVVIAVGVTMGSTLLACYSELHDAPAALMRPKAPKAGKLILLERAGFIWRRLNFSFKVTARNLFRYKKRLTMTLIGIAGCTALLLTGFGIRDSIGTLAQNQYGEVFIYQASVTFKDDLPDTSLDYLKENIEGLDGVKSTALAYFKTMDFTKQGQTPVTQATLTVFADNAAMEDYINLQTRVGKKPIVLPESGAIVDEKMSMEMGLKVGDVIVMQNGTAHYNVVVAGITENYIRHYVYMSETAYKEAAGKAAMPNHCFVNANDGADLNALCAKILMLPNVNQVSAYLQVKDDLKDTVAGLDSVVWVLIITAAALAFVVMYNLTNINIGERIREIATLKVLGFTKRETAMYVFRENILLSLLGIVLGCGFGIVMHRYIMTTVEVEGMMFGRQILPMSFLLAAAMTFAFTMLVNFVMIGRLSRIDMVESLKTVE